MKEFKFSVSAVLEYTVEAKTELQALKILVEKGGYDCLLYTSDAADE